MVVNTKKEELSKIKEFTNEIGVDAVLDAVGVSSSVNQAIEIVRNGGDIVLIGMASQTLEFEFKKVVCHEINLLGSYTYIDEMKESLEWIAKGKINLKDLITTIAPLEKGPEIFANLASTDPKDIKVVLTM
jgi:L-iditol 2-dehydrogenase